MAFRRDFSYLSRDGRARHTLARWAKDTKYTQEQLDSLKAELLKDKQALLTARNKKHRLIAYIDRLLYGVLIDRKLTADELALLLQHHKLAEEEMREIMLHFPLMFGGVKNRAGMKTGYGSYQL